MVELNLLPWRERRERTRQRQCYGLLFCGVCVFVLIHLSLFRELRRDKFAFAALEQSHATTEDSIRASNVMSSLQKMQSDQAVLSLLLERVISAAQQSDIQFTKLSFEHSTLQMSGRARAMPVYLTWVERISRHYSITLVSMKTAADSGQLEFHLFVR